MKEIIIISLITILMWKILGFEITALSLLVTILVQNPWRE